MAFQSVSKTLDLLIFLGLDLRCRDLRPQLNDPGKVFHSHRRRGHLLQLSDLLFQLTQLTAQDGNALKILLLCIFIEHPQLQLVVIPLLPLFRKQTDLLAAQIQVRTGFIQKVDGFIRQKAV